VALGAPSDHGTVTVILVLNGVGYTTPAVEMATATRLSRFDDGLANLPSGPWGFHVVENVQPLPVVSGEALEVWPTRYQLKPVNWTQNSARLIVAIGKGTVCARPVARSVTL
jgi:hypothetical protein